MFNDARGFEALITWKITGMQRIDVNERITTLERLNPILVFVSSGEKIGNGLRERQSDVEGEVNITG